MFFSNVNDSYEIKILKEHILKDDKYPLLQVEHVLVDRLSQFLSIDLHDAKVGPI